MAMESGVPITDALDTGSNRSSSPSNLQKALSVDRSSYSSAPASPSTMAEDRDEYGSPSADSLQTEFNSSTVGRSITRLGSRNSSPGTIDVNSDDTMHDYIHRKNSSVVRVDKGKERLQSHHSMDELSSFPSSSSSSSSPASSGLPCSRSSVCPEPLRGSQPRPSQVGSSTSVSSTRSRSSSMGVPNLNGGLAMVINTQLSASLHRLPVTIAVVGAAGSGKSTIIRKGCKPYGMSEPTSEILAAENPFKYTLRTGTIHQHQNATGKLHVIEVDLPELKLSSTGSAVWPETAPRIDGVIVCYDASDQTSFNHIEQLTSGYHQMMLPAVVIACKSDMTKVVDPQRACSMLKEYQIGLVEVTVREGNGKEKMRRCFDWMIKAIYRGRSFNRQEHGASYRNPASPEVIASPVPWDDTKTYNSIPISQARPEFQVVQARFSEAYFSDTSEKLQSRSPSAPSSPIRARSTNDLLTEHERSKHWDRDERGLNTFRTTTENKRASLPSAAPKDSLDESDFGKDKRQDQRLSPWATLDDLLDKLMFSAVSDDDRAFVSNFLLTYRRYATPRSVLLKMQKRMRELDHHSSDPMFACIAQMSICRLLDDWIHNYPYDFVVRGTQSALTALVKSVIAKTHLIHYSLEFLPFLEVLPDLDLVDQDVSWALKSEDPTEESDDSYSMFEGDDDLVIPDTDSPVSSSPSSTIAKPVPLPPPVVTNQSRKRKQSLPMTAKAPVMPNKSSILNPSTVDSIESSPKYILRELTRISQELYDIDVLDVAQEITRIQVKLFLDIQPRHWLKHTLLSTPKDPDSDTIARFGRVSNHIAEWVVSLILCHDKDKARARQIERFIEIGRALRGINNYSALRAVLAGINSATFEGDIPMLTIKQRNFPVFKSYQSWDLLFKSVGSHRSYRLALKGSKGACIPALEVHLLDLIRAHEGNNDYNGDDPPKIHWAKYNMVGKFIAGTKQFQELCRSTGQYNYPEQPHIRDLLLKECVMDVEMQKSRIAPPPIEVDSSDRVSLLNSTTTRAYPAYPRDAAMLRRIMFWAS